MNAHTAVNESDSRLDRPVRHGLRLLDLAALVVGYSLAALLIRACWPVTASRSFYVLTGLGIEYLWLGLAMSGPFVLLLNRRPRAVDTAEPERRAQRAVRRAPEAGRPPEPRYTGPELAWLLIGGYWIGMTLLVVPARLPASSAPLLGLLPFIVAAILAFIGPKRSKSSEGRTAWTHRAAVVLLSSWPVAWISLIALSQLL